MHIPKKDYEKLKLAVEKAFNADDLDQFVRFVFDESLDSIAGAGNHSKKTFELIEWARERDRVDELFRAARERRPNNRDLAALATIEPEAEWQHRMELVPSLWKAKWTVADREPIAETLQIDTWIGENEFEGFGFSDHGTETEPVTYNYTFNGSIEPTGIIVLEYRAERYPVKDGKNVGIAILEIKNDRRLEGFYSGYFDNRSREEWERDRATHPEESVSSKQFFIPFGSMSYYGGAVAMILSGRGKARSQ